MDNEDNEIVITGTGVCCNLGEDLADILAQLRSGKPKFTFEKWQPAIDHGARCNILGKYNGDVSDAALGVSKAEGRFMGRQSRMALKAARIALAESKMDPREAAVVVGSGTGDVETQNDIHDKLGKTKNATKILPTVIPRLMASTASANLVNVLKTIGPSFSATAACSGGAYNVLLAASLMASGHAKCAIAGGVEVADLNFYAGFDSMRAYNGQDNDHPERASRPYAADRAGFIFAEGSGIVVLEKRADAVKRGAKILGTLAGWGMSSDGEGNMVAPASNGAYEAMKRALEHAKVGPETIGYVNTHGTSTPLGDIGEVKAIQKALGGRRVAYSSTKAYTGHTISAAGTIEAIFTCAMIREGWLAPAIHAEPLDPEIADYPPVLAPTNVKLEYALSNSFGFGGTNVSLVLAP
jgi:3-oxoacyl-[acyl-carrier-protein] synthase-1